MKKRRGKYTPPKTRAETWEVIRLRRAGWIYRDIMAATGFSMGTVVKMVSGEYVAREDKSRIK